ncbi:transposase (fragment) [Thiocapsa sp. KS1]
MALTPETVATIEAQVRRRVLRWFSRHGLLDPEDARDMLAWDNSGFSLDASVRIAGHDRPGLERLLRYCARPPSPLSASNRSTRSGSSIACRSPNATGAPRCPSPRWSSSITSSP